MPLHDKTKELLKRLNAKWKKLQDKEADNSLIDGIYDSEITEYKEPTRPTKVPESITFSQKWGTPICVACSGTGVSSKGKECYPCCGTGREGEKAKR